MTFHVEYDLSISLHPYRDGQLVKRGPLRHYRANRVLSYCSLKQNSLLSRSLSMDYLFKFMFITFNCVCVFVFFYSSSRGSLG